MSTHRHNPTHTIHTPYTHMHTKCMIFHDSFLVSLFLCSVGLNQEEVLLGKGFCSFCYPQQAAWSAGSTVTARNNCSYVAMNKLTFPSCWATQTCPECCMFSLQSSYHTRLSSQVLWFCGSKARKHNRQRQSPLR